MKQIRVYTLQLISLTASDQYLLSDIQLQIKFGQQYQYSDIIPIRDKFNLLDQFEFTIKPRSQSDWSILIDCWEYNRLTHQLQNSLIGSTIIDLSGINVNQKLQDQPLILKNQYSQEAQLQFKINLSYQKINILNNDLKSPTKQMDRMLYLMNLEKVSEKDNRVRCYTPEVKQRQNPQQKINQIYNISPLKKQNNYIMRPMLMLPQKIKTASPYKKMQKYN